MKNLILTFSFFWMSFAQLFANGGAVSLLPGIVQIGTGSNGDCEINLTLTIYTANLDILNGANPGDCPSPLSLPNGVAPMFLELSVDGQQQSLYPITVFTLFQCTGVGNWNGPAIYKHTIETVYDFSDLCTPLTVGGNLEIHARLLAYKPSTDEYIPYPICDKVVPEGLFSCLVFAETAPYCSNPSLECDDANLSSEIIEVPYSCLHLCHRDDDMDGSNSENLQNEDSNELLVEVSPNPFKDVLQIHCLSETNNPIFMIYDVNGKLMKSLSNSSSEKGTYLEWDINELPKGMYFLHIQNGTESKYIKLFKS